MPITATPHERLRNGKRGIESAIKAYALSEWKESYYVDTLAAAHAEAGAFAKAVEFQIKANAMFDDAVVKKGGRVAAEARSGQDALPRRRAVMDGQVGGFKRLVAQTHHASASAMMGLYQPTRSTHRRWPS